MHLRSRSMAASAGQLPGLGCRTAENRSTLPSFSISLLKSFLGALGSSRSTFCSESSSDPIPALMKRGNNGHLLAKMVVLHVVDLGSASLSSPACAAKFLIILGCYKFYRKESHQERLTALLCCEILVVGWGPAQHEWRVNDCAHALSNIFACMQSWKLACGQLACGQRGKEALQIQLTKMGFRASSAICKRSFIQCLVKASQS